MPENEVLDLKVKMVVVGMLAENCWLVYDAKSKSGVIIDPGDEASRIIRNLEEEHVQPEAILLTHGHIDHMGGVGALKQELGIPLYMHRDELELYRAAPQSGAMFGIFISHPPEPDGFLEEGSDFTVGSLSLNVLHTPGHTLGHVTLVARDHAFVGDCLFAGSIGRTDLPGGSYETLMSSLRDKILVLPDETHVHSGHGLDSTIGREKLTNPFLR